MGDADEAKWEGNGWGEYVFVEQMTGRVLGRVVSVGGTWRGFTDARPVGEYMTRDRARDGVERALFYTPPAP